MRIGLDVQTLQTAEATRGIGRVVRSLGELLVRETTHELVLLGRDEDPGDLRDWLSDRVRYTAIRCGDGSSAPEMVAQAPVADFLGFTPGTEGLDLYHATSPMMPDILLAGVPDAGGDKRRPICVATLYDAIPALWAARRTPLMDRGAMAALNVRAAALRDYDWYLPISRSTARDCSILQDLDPGRMTVTYVPCAPFVPLADEEALALTRSVGVDGGHILCISGYNPRKNLRGTLTGFACLPLLERQRHPLVLVCKLQPSERQELEDLARDLGIGPNFIATGYVSDEVLRALLQTAALLFFPSEYEGFGLPVAEALLAGVPVVTRNNSSLPEVMGPGGILTGPGDGEAADAMMRILTMPHLREQLAEAGRNHAMQFLPDRFLDRILEGYQAALQPQPVVLETSGAAMPGKDGLEPRRDLSESERTELRRSLGVPGHGLLVLAGGGATAANRTEVLAAVLEALVQRHPGTVLALTGECERDEIRLLYTWASRRNLRHALLVTGNLPTEELVQWLAVADVVLAPGAEAVDGGFTKLALSHGHGPLLLRGGSCSGVPTAVAAWSAPRDGNESAHIVGAVEILHRRADVAAELVGAARAGAEVGAD